MRVFHLLLPVSQITALATFRRKIDVVRDFGRWGDRKQSPPDG
jgi:hypothetical protein